MTPRRFLSRLAVLGLALALVGSLGCSDGDDDRSSDAGSEETSGDGNDESTTESTEDEETTTESTEDDTTEDDTTEDGTTEDDGTVPSADDMSDRLPDLDGYTREDGDEEFDLTRCDGGTYSVTPEAQANATYTPEGEPDATAQAAVTFGGIRFESADEAQTFWDEITGSIPECVGSEEQVGDAEPLDFGEESLLFPVEREGTPSGALLLSRNGDEIWLVVEPFAEGQESETDELVDALEEAVEG
jgi:hypothetical protein